MKKTFTLLLIFFTLQWHFSEAQVQPSPIFSCGSTHILNEQALHEPTAFKRILNFQEQAHKALKDKKHVNGANRRTNSLTNITIPVVVHVVGEAQVVNNVTDQQVQNQISVLNQTFSSLTDTKIRFCLASFDENGNPTSGITRTITTETEYYQTININDTKFVGGANGKSAWNRDQYLNIWVFNLKNTAASTGATLQGYATMPGANANVDGIYIHYEWFGTGGSANSSSLGKVATHEVGHWLGLNHPWGNTTGTLVDGDNIPDTPPSSGPIYACPQPSGSVNYMDYPHEYCKDTFTPGQALVMQQQFAYGGARRSLLFSRGCNNSTTCVTPEGLFATPTMTAGEYTLYWENVSPSGCNTLYNIQTRIKGATTWSTQNLTPICQPSSPGQAQAICMAEIAGLAPNTEYEFRVQADCNACSGGTTSDWSNPYEFRTPSSIDPNVTAAIIPDPKLFKTSAEAPYGAFYKQMRVQYIIPFTELSKSDDKTKFSNDLELLSLSFTPLEFYYFRTSSEPGFPITLNNFTIRLKQLPSKIGTQNINNEFLDDNFIDMSTASTVFSKTINLNTSNDWRYPKHEFTTSYLLEKDHNLVIDITFDNTQQLTSTYFAIPVFYKPSFEQDYNSNGNPIYSYHYSTLVFESDFNLNEIKSVTKGRRVPLMPILKFDYINR